MVSSRSESFEEEPEEDEVPEAYVTDTPSTFLEVIFEPSPAEAREA